MKILKKALAIAITFALAGTFYVPANAANTLGEGYGEHALFYDFEDGDCNFTTSNAEYSLETEDTWGDSKASARVKYTGLDGRISKKIALDLSLTYEVSFAFKMIEDPFNTTDVRLVMLYSDGAYTEHVLPDVSVTSEWGLYKATWKFPQATYNVSNPDNTDQDDIMFFLRVGDPEKHNGKEFLIDDISIRAVDGAVDDSVASADNVSLHGKLLKDFEVEIAYDYTGNEAEGNSFYRLYRESADGTVLASVDSGYIKEDNSVKYKFTEADLGYKMRLEVTPYSADGTPGATRTYTTGDVVKLQYDIQPVFTGDLTEGATLNCAVSFTNNFDVDQNVIAVLAIYNSKNSMIGMVEYPLPVDAGETETLAPSITVPAGAASAKIYLWEGEDLLNSGMTSYMLSENR